MKKELPKTTCLTCGSTFVKSNIKRHNITYKHINYNKEIQPKKETPKNNIKEKHRQELIDGTKIYLNYFNILTN
jgi:hypothetical protein